MHERASAGARRYVLKGSNKAEILSAVRAVASGETVFGPPDRRRLIEYFSAAPTGPRPFPQLTPREREVLELIGPRRAPPHDRGEHRIAERPPGTPSSRPTTLPPN